MSVATGRWPAVRFAVRNTVVQGPNAVPQIVEALRELDADPAVDVIVVARGGGSVEDLLPFSDETLCRAISACTTPVVSAVGHEPDNPLCDLVADLRAATPTDAAKRIVPDTAAEQALLLRSATAQRAGAAQLGAPRAAPREPTAQQAGTGPAAGRADHAGRRDSPRQDRRPARHHAAGGRRIGAGRPHVGPARARWDPPPPLPVATRWCRRCRPQATPECCTPSPTRPLGHGCGYGCPTGPSRRSAREANEAC